jgi:hypothetical protein
VCGSVWKNMDRSVMVVWTVESDEADMDMAASWSSEG